nr:hypothetical protein [Paraburkholderia solitsugae]
MAIAACHVWERDGLSASII